MSKIICDVCGTSYPDTAEQCPICGCVRSGNSGIMGNHHDDGEGQTGGYTYIKGGRFSKSNVRKRNKGHRAPEQHSEPVYETTEQEEKPKNSVGLIIAVLLLLLTVIAVVVYISISFFWPVGGQGSDAPETTAAQETSTETTVLEIPCVGLSSDRKEIPLGKNDGWLLSVTKDPADTTDELTFRSNNTKIVTVDSKGMITPVSAGKTEIVATCGDQTYTWVVICEKESPEETTGETTAETTEETTVSTENDEFHLNRKDITFSYKDESWDLYSGSVAVSKITWTSDDETVAKIDKGIVTAVGNGVTTVHGTYNGEKASCIIRCNLGTEDENLGGGGVGEDNGGTSADAGSDTATYHIQNPFGGTASDLTLSVGESIGLSLRNSSGQAVSATWSTANSSVCKVDGSGTITAIGSGVTTLTAQYNGKTYSCIIRVK